MRPVEDLERELARVTAERNALARHIEVLVAPVTVQEAREVETATFYDLEESDAAELLENFIAARQRKAQFAAFG